MEPSSTAEAEEPDAENSEANSTCMICMEEWTIGSEHRICCLKCGHLFGRSCIERWIKEKGSSAKCPTCNKPAKKPDVRDLWCKAIRASDTTELSTLQQLLENERKLRKTDSAVIFHQNLKLELLHGDLDKLKKGIIERDEKIKKLEAVLDRFNKLRAQRLATSMNEESLDADTSSNLLDNEVFIEIDVEPKELKGMFHFAEKVESGANGTCKSFALCPTASIILVSQQAPQGTNSVFGGFGLRKYSTRDTTIREFIPLHSKLINSIQLKPIGDLILTASQDKRIRLTSISNNTCVQSYQCEYEPTSVAWSTHRDQQFYVGYGNCYVALFDIRNISEHIYQTDQKVAKTRLLSIASTTGADNLNGLLVNDAKGCQFLEVSDASDYTDNTIDRSDEHMKSQSLPFEGLMGTVDFNKTQDLALITTRRSSLTPYCTHNLMKLRRVFEEDGSSRVDCRRVRTFIGSRSEELLSQSRILKHPTLDNSVLVGSCDASVGGFKLWDSSDNTEFQSIRTGSFIRDLIMYNPENSNQHILYALSANGLHIYRWDYA